MGLLSSNPLETWAEDVVSSTDVGTPPRVRPSPRGWLAVPLVWVPASGLAVATRVSSPTRRYWRFSFQPFYGVVQVHAKRSRSLLRRTDHGDDELRRAHRRAARPADPGSDWVVCRRARGFHSAARHRLPGHEEDGGAGEASSGRAFYREEYDKKSRQAELEKEKSPELQAVVDAGRRSSAS